MTDEPFMRLALGLARRGRGATSPNPMVGAVLVQGDRLIGRGWHRRAGGPHAEIEAIAAARRHGHDPRGATLYVTLEPCSTHGRTPPCTEAIRAAGIARVIVGATDPNPAHAGRGFRMLRRAGVEVRTGALGAACIQLNEAFNHWIVNRTPFVTVKTAMTLDGKIATATGESKWITGEKARAYAMRLRRENDAVLVGIRTVLSDDPALVVRNTGGQPVPMNRPPLRRIILDTRARTPLNSNVVTDDRAAWTTIVVGRDAPAGRVAALSKQVRVLVAPTRHGQIDVGWLLRQLGAEQIISLLVEGGGEVNSSFLLGGHAQRVKFFYAPIILGGAHARKAVAGIGATTCREMVPLEAITWRRLGQDLLLTARVRAEGFPLPRGRVPP
jgi:diaminohydroxyphosphoribosylaminopyrimidine deaminase / 5-amino-6-(5-phosphoribosylamino)uracil reductase